MRHALANQRRQKL
ncbi:hypothetical protein VCHC57A1_2394, partial [Vibrio cholerae HC-57A1]